MRILFTSTAGLGHLYPLMPLARAARDARRLLADPEVGHAALGQQNARAPCTSRTVSAREQANTVNISRLTIGHLQGLPGRAHDPVSKGTVTQLRDTPPSGTGPLIRLLCACLCR